LKQSKACTKCGQIKQKTSTFFYKDSGQSSGLKPECKQCTLALKKIYYQNNKEALRERSRKYRANNPDKWKEIKSNFRKRNPEKGQAERRSRYLRKYGGNHIFYTVSQVLQNYGTNCHLCGQKIDLLAPRSAAFAGWEYGLQIDHVIRLKDGGDDTIENVRPSHGICNAKKN
jgi:hypothetical protein